MKSLPWRVCFVLSAIFMGIGGPMHPDGTMAEMLASPVWFAGHAWVCAAFVALLVGLVLYGRAVVFPARTRRWLQIAIVVTALQAIEMAVHAAAYVDLQNLLAGRSTPVLSTHLMMTVIIYPIFGVLMSGFIIVAARERALGALWMGWIGVIGALAHGAAGLLVVGFNSEVARLGFPLIMLVMIWALIAALMPRRALASMSTQPT